jgi:hypothetical protein
MVFKKKVMKTRFCEECLFTADEVWRTIHSNTSQVYLEHAKLVCNITARWQAVYFQNGCQWRGEGMINNNYSGHQGYRTLWGLVKNNAYKPPLPKNVCELQDRIQAVVQNIGGNMVKCVWHELEYRTDICRVMNGTHIEHL